MTSRRRATQEIHHDRHEPIHPIQLHDLRWNAVHLRLPKSHPSRLRLRPAVPMRPELHLPPVLIRAAPREFAMNAFVLAYLGGILGAVLMDITETAMARVSISSGVNVALVGRWFLGLTRGRVAHPDIRSSPSLPREVGLGWAFHLLVGGGGVALIYPVVLLFPGMPSPTHAVLGGLLFGLLTSLLPWLVLLPAFGWGWFGRRGPHGANALLASPLSHIPYGLGVSAVMALGQTVG
jgi:Protein of unknown function (DUF2938)